MLTSKFIIDVLTLYGPLSLGWVVASVLGILMTKMWRGHREDYHGLVKDMQHSLDNNTKVLTAINVRLEERSK